MSQDAVCYNAGEARKVPTGKFMANSVMGGRCARSQHCVPQAALETCTDSQLDLMRPRARMGASELLLDVSFVDACLPHLINRFLDHDWNRCVEPMAPLPQAVMKGRLQPGLMEFLPA